MKNKKLTYILLALVLGIWGNVVWKIISSVSDYEDQRIAPNISTQIEDYKERPSTELILDYRDPFLEIKKPRKIVHSIPRKVNSPKKVGKKNTEVNWPMVEYNGSITNSTANSRMALVKINSVEYLLQESDQKDGILVKKIYPDSITLAYLDNIKTLHK